MVVFPVRRDFLATVLESAGFPGILAPWFELCPRYLRARLFLVWRTFAIRKDHASRITGRLKPPRIELVMSTRTS